VRVFSRVPRGAPCIVSPPRPPPGPSASSARPPLSAQEIAELRLSKAEREARREAREACEERGALQALAVDGEAVRLAAAARGAIVAGARDAAAAVAAATPVEGVVIDPREERPFVPHDVRMRVLTTGR
jgi:hypothetical protein